MASTGSDNPGGSTPVPPRGGGRNRARPGRPGTSRPAPSGNGSAAGRPPAGGRPAAPRSPGGGRAAVNRRAAVAEQRRHRQTMIAMAAIGVVVIVVAVLVIVKATGGGNNNTAGSGGNSTGGGVVSAAQYRQLTSPGVATLAAAAKHFHTADLVFPQVTSDPPITKSGKPEILFVGAQYCPYCATERWALVLALSKFGTFSHLGFIHSDNNASEAYRRVPTMTFYKSSYTSPYLTFVAKETETVSGATLQKLTPAQNSLVSKYDVTQQGTRGSIPFVYFNGKAVLIGAEYNPQPLIGQSYQSIIDQIAKGTTNLGASVQADAGAIVSDICHMTGGKPANVCSAFPTPLTGS